MNGCEKEKSYSYYYTTDVYAIDKTSKMQMYNS